MIMCQKFPQKMTWSSFLVVFASFSFHQLQVDAGNIPLPLGIVFGQGTPETQTAFKHALLTFTLNITTNPRDIYRFTAYVDTINTADAFKLSKLICNQFSRGIFAMVGSMNSDSFHVYNSFANTFHIPLITPWSKEGSDIKKNGNGMDDGGMDYATRIRPNFNPAILDTIHYYGWKEIIYLYSSTDGLLRLQTLFYRPSEANQMLRVKVVKKISTASQAISVLREIEAVERFAHKYVLLDAPTPLAKEIILAHVRDVQLGRRNYHYLLADLAFDDTWESNVLEYQAINITGFRMVDTGRKYVQDFLQKWSTLDTVQFPGAGKDSISANAAFMYDAMLIIKESFTDILTDNPFAFSRYNAESACESGSDFLDDIRPFEFGKNVNEHLRRVQISEGLTGNLQFHSNGTRKYFSVDVMELHANATKVKIAQWTDYSGFKVEKVLKDGESEGREEKDVYVISTILEEPFLKLKSPSQRKNLSGNDLYEGYVKDLADLLFANLNAKYRLQLVKDGKYGTKIPTGHGENWNGIVGELIAKKADLSIAPLTITAERERVLEFTKPFLTQGISIMAFKPKKFYPGMFSFMNPLSDWVWLAMLGAYVGVSAVFYLIYRLTAVHSAENQNLQINSQQFHQQHQHQRLNGELNAKFQHQQCQINANQGSTQMYLIQKKGRGGGSGREGTTPPVSNFLWMAFSILTNNRGTYFVSRSIAGKFASTVWWMFAIILVSVYTGNYIAIRMRSRVSAPIRSAWDLVDRSGIQYGTLESGSTYDFFKNSENQVYRAMFEHISGPNQQNMPSYEDGINTVRQKKGKYVFILESAKIDYVSNRRPCNTMKVGYDLAEIHYGIGLPVGSPLTNKMNMEILKLRETGKLRQLEEKWWMNNIHCQVATKLDQLQSGSGEEQEQLPLQNLAGIFYILIIGMVIAVLVSFFEFFCSSSSSKKKDPATVSTSKALSSSAPMPKLQHLHHNHQHHHQIQGGDTLLLHRNSHSHCHSSHQNSIIDSVPMPNDFCDISPDMNTNK